MQLYKYWHPALLLGWHMGFGESPPENFPPAVNAMIATGILGIALGIVYFGREPQPGTANYLAFHHYRGDTAGNYDCSV